ncbi:hypothetical protein [Geopsychrobacter electrodiphilus]|uniref:hypothetical protein n=1 Tax=Geopsychrobacter electrodiphilus TaxID=225196 RepID=UPI0003691FEB|nr:hypothetical protein [Geopsychrobacter electrodiphilus]
MISHFNLSGYENSFYFAISSIQPSSAGLKISGIVGDGSAEDWFEACVGDQLKVVLLPIWESEGDSLSGRYEQEVLEEGLTRCFKELSFRSEKSFNSETGQWLQKFVAVAEPSCAPFWPMSRIERPHQWICEPGPVWRKHQLG